MSHLRILVVTSCTGQKQFKPDYPLKQEDCDRSDRQRRREQELAEYKCAAGQMYRGLQHLRVMEGVALLRKALGNSDVDVAILSAGYGLIWEHQEIVPYEVSFNTFRYNREVDRWSKFLGVHEAFEKAIAPYDIVFILLGDKYVHSLSLPVKTHQEQTLIFLASQGSTRTIPNLEAKTFVLPLTNIDARRYSYGLVGLKVFLFKLFAQFIVQYPESIEKVYLEPKYFKQVINSHPQQLDLYLVSHN